jgi:hypothetical protein
MLNGIGVYGLRDRGCYPLKNGACRLCRPDACNHDNDNVSITYAYPFGIPFSNQSRNPNDSIGHGHHAKAFATMYALLQRCRDMGIHNVRLLYNLFRALVAPVLAYGSEVWSVYELASSTTQGPPLGTDNKLLGERVHKAFLRDTLQVPATMATCTAMLMSEVGAVPLAHIWAQQMTGW